MSKLDDLIKNLCPDGVEFKKLGEIANYSRERISAENLTEDNYVGVDNLLSNKRGKIFSSHLPVTGNFAKFFSEDILIGNIRPYLKKIWLADCEGGASGDVLTIQVENKNIIRPKFLYYFLSSDNFFHRFNNSVKGGKMPRGDKNFVMKYEIPIPPLEVQREIVRILDNFTELTAELTAKLTAELTARKKQYEFYRDLLLTFDDATPTILQTDRQTDRRVEFKKLGEIAEIGTGNSNTNSGFSYGLYPFYVRSETPLYKNEFEYDETAIITAGDGVGVGKVFHYIEGKYALHQRAYRIHIVSSEVIPKYFYYYMRTRFLNYIEKNMYQSSVPSIRRPMLNNFPVPVPPIEEQERIVKILDRFDKLCNDISEGLPAEISARQKQYEYYRDKLLNFKEKN